MTRMKVGLNRDKRRRRPHLPTDCNLAQVQCMKSLKADAWNLLWSGRRHQVHAESFWSLVNFHECDGTDIRTWLRTKVLWVRIPSVVLFGKINELHLSKWQGSSGSRAAAWKAACRGCERLPCHHRFLVYAVKLQFVTSVNRMQVPGSWNLTEVIRPVAKLGSTHGS